jgi:hypothetical protein
MKNLTYARRVAVQDAIFYAQATELAKRQLTAQLLADPRLAAMSGLRLEAMQTLRKHLGLSRTRCRWLLDGKATLADFYGVADE